MYNSYHILSRYVTKTAVMNDAMFPIFIMYSVYLLRTVRERHPNSLRLQFAMATVPNAA